jgi:hypothetical protein
MEEANDAEFCNLSARSPESMREHTMKLLTLFAAALFAGASLFAADSSASAAAASAPAPVWSFRLSLQESKTPLQQELLKKFQPVLGVFSSADFFKQLAWIQILGLGDAKHLDDGAFLLHLHFRDDATARSLVQKLGDKDSGNWESIDGLAVLKINVALQNRGSDTAYLAIPDIRHLVLCSGREALDFFSAMPPESYLSDLKDGQLLSADFNLGPLKDVVQGSELLALLGGHVGLKVVPGGEFVNVESSAELADKRSANRARRMLEGLVAAVAAQLPPEAAEPLDERLELTAEDKTLTAKVKLTNAEVQRWLEAIEMDIKTGIEAGIQAGAKNSSRK